MLITDIGLMKHVLASSALGFLLAVAISLGNHHAHARDVSALVPFSLKEAPTALFGDSITLVGKAEGFGFKQPILLAQVDSRSDQVSDSFTEEDAYNVLVGLSVLLILPLFWKPTRKAIGLLNIIVGTVLTLTGIGALVGIPMILIGGICLFI